LGLADRHRIERAKWDELAGGIPDAELELPDHLDFHAYAARTATMPGVSEFVGDLRGLRVLDYGCGKGLLTTLLARCDARVTGFDISSRSVEVTRRRAQVNGVADRVTAVTAAGEALPFA